MLSTRADGYDRGSALVVTGRRTGGTARVASRASRPVVGPVRQDPMTVVLVTYCRRVNQSALTAQSAVRNTTIVRRGGMRRDTTRATTNPTGAMATSSTRAAHGTELWSAVAPFFARNS